MDFWQTLRQATRSCFRTPILTSAAILTLALGISASAAMFEVVDRLFLRGPSHVVDPGRVVRVQVQNYNRFVGRYVAPIGTFQQYEAFRDRATSFSGVAAYGVAHMSAGLGENAEGITADLVTASFLPLLGVKPEIGRFFGSDEDQVGTGAHVAVLSHEFWKRRYGGGTAVLGTALLLGSRPYTVVGVAPEGFAGIDLSVPDVWLPITTAAPEAIGTDALSPTWSWMNGVIGRLRSGTKMASAAAEGTVIYRSRYPDRRDSASISLGSVHDLPGLRSSKKLTLWLSAVSGFVLLIACANVANLLLARGLQRRRELSLRSVLGATQWKLAKQLLTECAVLSAGGTSLGIAMTALMAPLIFRTILSNATLGATLNLRILAFVVLAGVTTVALSGLFPSILSCRGDASEALKTGSREGGVSRSRLPTVLLVLQFALTVVLLSGAGLFVLSFKTVRDISPGFDANHLISISEDLAPYGYTVPAIDQIYGSIAARLEAVSGVEGVSLAVGSPWGVGVSVSMTAPGVDSMPQFEGGGPYVNAVSPAFFRVAGVSLRQGRAFTEGDSRASGWVSIVSLNMAERVWPGQNAIGKCLMLMRRPTCTEVVGVVENTHHNRLVEKSGAAEFYIPLTQRDSVSTSPVTALLVRTRGAATSQAESVRHEIQASFPNLPYPRVDAYPTLFAPELRPWKAGSTLLVIFGVVGLLLSALGLIGVLTHSVTQRTQELGIRMALGAPRGRVLAQVVRRGLLVALWGIGVGIAASLLAGKLVSSMLYGVSPRDPFILGGVAALLIAIAVVASLVPALRATAVDPIVALRYD